MRRLTILYRAPADPAEFRRYYLDEHVPLARRMRGLSGWTLQWLDPASGWILVADLMAESAEAMAAILASPEGRAASADVPRFAQAGVEFLEGDVDEVALA